jgi:transposase
MRIVGMDIHRVAAEVVSLQDGQIRRLGRVPMLREALEAFAQKQLSHDDHVVIELTGNAAALVDVISPHVDHVIVANPRQVRLIAHAKVKTDAIDAAVLAKLYASGFLPEVWSPNQKTLALRRQVARRTQFVRQRVRLKNLIQSILHANLVSPCPHGDLVGISGGRWLAKQVLPDNERIAIDQQLSQIEQIEASLKLVDADIARYAIGDPQIRRLMTVPGVDVTVNATDATEPGNPHHIDNDKVRRCAAQITVLGKQARLTLTPEGQARRGTDSDILDLASFIRTRLPRDVIGANRMNRPIRSETRATLLETIAKASLWLDELTSGRVATIDALADREGHMPLQVTATLSCAFLAPDIVAAAIDGTLPDRVGAVRVRDRPAEWTRHRQMLGLIAMSS